MGQDSSKRGAFDSEQKERVQCFPDPRIREFWINETNCMIEKMAPLLKTADIDLERVDIERFIVRTLINEIVEDIEWAGNRGATNDGTRKLFLPIFDEDLRRLVKAFRINQVSLSVGTRLIFSRLYHLRRENANLPEKVIREIERGLK